MPRPLSATPSSTESTWRLFARDLFGSILPAILIAILIQLFLAQSTRVVSYSMEPTLFEAQRLVIEKVSYRLHTPQRGDIVVVEAPDGGDTPLIKRVVGLPGDQIAIQEGRVLIDGVPLTEPYLQTAMHGSLHPITVPADHVFLMGDNRDHSYDSRSFGSVPFHDILGRAWLRYWPPNKAGLFTQP